jgi:hypothetical protein
LRAISVFLDCIVAFCYTKIAELKYLAILPHPIFALTLMCGYSHHLLPVPTAIAIALTAHVRLFTSGPKYPSRCCLNRQAPLFAYNSRQAELAGAPGQPEGMPVFIITDVFKAPALIILYEYNLLPITLL